MAQDRVVTRQKVAAVLAVEERMWTDREKPEQAARPFAIIHYQERDGVPESATSWDPKVIASVKSAGVGSVVRLDVEEVITRATIRVVEAAKGS